MTLLLPIPEADAIFFPRIIGDEAPLYQATYTYDGNLRLVHVNEYHATQGQFSGV